MHVWQIFTKEDDRFFGFIAFWILERACNSQARGQLVIIPDIVDEWTVFRIVHQAIVTDTTLQTPVLNRKDTWLSCFIRSP